MSHRNDVGCLGQDGAPHTPLPYNISSYFAPRIEGSLQTAVNEGESDKSSPKHSKRPRDGDESDQEWTAHELGLVENMLLQPSGQFPPGSLPPSTVLDDLTTRLLQSQTTMSEKSRSPGEDSITTIWLHSWDSTRQKMNEIALGNSRFGIEEERRKLPREERSERPGLRRMDSMDFLDEGNAADRSTSAVGRALRFANAFYQISPICRPETPFAPTAKGVGPSAVCRGSATVKSSPKGTQFYR
ncbi:hypothetical protein I350_07349 [Cryptococcus amylolentus CBS 6273]|uniref:Uncharacterized protein n=1 Tax=Cryptococcus amylolentus CBS 6273 TaxID=1296118 RepID=A0A1E3JE82_9TREE|nr:hypothetical protein I350_07349 [Cryptococcus amylolentus CBS 6273]